MKKRQWISGLLSVVMAVSLTACARGDVENGMMKKTVRELVGAGAQDEMPGEGADGNEALGEQPEKKIRIFSNRTESHVAYQILQDIISQYQQEVNPNFTVEFETEPNLDQYKNKLKLYISGNELPDMFQIDKGPIAEELTARGTLVNMDEQLKEAGLLEDLNEACRQYVANEDGSLYIMPEARYGNTFFYWKDKFEAAGIKDLPKNFDEFLAVCETLKQAGEIPIGITGKASWNPLHIMYLPSWTVTGNDWLETAKKGETKFADEQVVKDSTEFIYTLGERGYFQPGFGNIEYTDVVNGFLGGQYAMVWAQSVYLSQFSEDYDKGNLGFMEIPMNDKEKGYEQKGTIAIHTGISWALNKEKFDPEMERFYQFLLSRYSDTCYKYDTFPPFNTEVPQDKSKIMKDYYGLMEKQTIGWSNWDDNCDPVTCQLMDDLVKQLVQGMITPEDFLEQIDASAAENGAAYFKN